MTIFRRCDQILETGRSVVMATVVKASQGTPGKPGFKLLLTEDGELFGTVGGGALEERVIEEAREVLRDQANRILHYNLADLNMKCGGNADVVIEYISAVKRILLFGGGHIARALTPILESVGFAVTIIDPRPDVQPHFEGSTSAAILQLDYEDLSPEADLIRGVDWCFIATHGHDYDFTVISQLLTMATAFRYIGMIGSRRKIDSMRRKLEEEGISIPDYLYAPVGIKIGGQSAAEIAVSIAAEIVAVLNNSEVTHMRLNDQ